jgi:porin
MKIRNAASVLAIFTILIASASAQDSNSGSQPITPTVESNLQRWWHGDLVGEVVGKSRTLLADVRAMPGEAYRQSKAYLEQINFSGVNAEQWDQQFQNYWTGSGVTANWFGLGKPMKDYGLTISGTAREVFLGQLSGGLPNVNKGSWINEEKLAFVYNFGKAFGLNGLTIESNWRYRNVDGDPNNAYNAWGAGTVGNSSMFNPSKDTSGMGVRILPQFIKWQTGDAKDPDFMAKAGWINPYEDFLNQPDSKYFQNNAIATAKGIGGAAGPGTIVGYNNGVPVLAKTTGVPWSSSYASWGGELRAKPSSSTYVMGYLGLAIGGYSGVQGSPYTYSDVYPYTSTSQQYLGSQKQPVQTVSTVNYRGQANGTTTKNSQYVYNNHGFNFQGAKSYNNPNVSAAYPGGSYYNNNTWTQNGLYTVEEVGWTPKLGADKLAGKYALGGYLWGQNNTSYTPVSYINGQSKPYPAQGNSVVWGLYLQADQRLTAVRTSESTSQVAAGKNPVDGKNPAASSTKVPDKVRGLYSFNEFSFTPQQNNAIPFYFQTGLIYKGLLDARPKDACGIVLGAGFYSQSLNDYTTSQNQALISGYNGNNLTSANTVPNGPTTAGGKNYYAYLPAYSSTEVLEAFYNVQVNKWLQFRPDAQYIINPAGNGTCANDWILGAEIQATF